MPRSLIAAVVALFSTASLVHSAHASTIVYSNQNLWNNAITVTGGDNYNGYTWNSLGGTLFGSSTTLAGITYTNSGAAAQIYGIPFTYSGDAAYLVSNYLEWQSGSPNALTITLPTAVNAVGFDFGQAFGLFKPGISVTLDSGFTASAPNTSGYAFFGVVSDVPFTTLTLNSAWWPGIDNFSYGVLASVPEPATLALFGLGLLGLGVARRRKGT